MLAGFEVGAIISVLSVLGLKTIEAATLRPSTTTDGAARAAENLRIWTIVGSIFSALCLCGLLGCCFQGIFNGRKTKIKTYSIDRPVAYTHTSGSTSAINAALRGPAYPPVYPSVYQPSR